MADPYRKDLPNGATVIVGQEENGNVAIFLENDDGIAEWEISEEEATTIAFGIIEILEPHI